MSPNKHHESKRDKHTCKIKHDKVKKSFKGPTGFNIVPSDANCATGEKDYLVVVNQSIVFYDKCTNKINAQYFLSNFTASTRVTNQPFFPTTLPTSSPYIVYDPHVKRFVMVCTAITDDTDATIYFAISKGETFCDYLNDWYKYTIDLGYDGASLPDSPKIGFDEKAYYITARVFLPGPTQEDRIYGFTKREVLKGDPIAEVVNVAFTSVDYLQPLKVYDCSSPMVFAAADITSNPATTISFITIYNFTTITGPTAFTVDPYFQPGDAPQLGGIDLSTVGAVFTSGSLRCGHVWLAQTVGLSNGNVKVRWYDILYDGSVFTANQSQTIGLCDNVAYFIPHIDVDQHGNMGLGFSALDALNPNGADIGFVGRMKNDLPNTTHPIKIVKCGEGIYNFQDADVNAWGAYSGLCFDPSEEKLFWLVGQYGFDTSIITASYKTHNALMKLSESNVCCQHSLIQIPINNANTNNGLVPLTLHTMSRGPRIADF